MSGRPGECGAAGTGAGGWASPVVVLALAWVVGTWLGVKCGGGWWWMAGAGMVAGVAVGLGVRGWRSRQGSAVAGTAADGRGTRRWSDRAVRWWGLLAVVLVAAAWGAVREHHLPADHIRRYLGDTPQLAVVTGVVDNQPHLAPGQRGALAEFGYEPPATLFTLSLRALVVAGQEQPASGRLLVKIKAADAGVPRGVLVRASGWLSEVRGPANPGERDFRAILEQRGIVGRLTLDGKENWQTVAGPGVRERVAAWQQAASARAAAALHLGLPGEPQRLAFLEAILLGRWGEELLDLQEAFRKVGLMHILSISGAHLALLVAMVWGVLRAVGVHPRKAAAVMLAVLAAYLLVLPPQVPLVRAGIMAGLVGVGLATGRRGKVLDLVALATIVVLAWRPGDVAAPGFQLSFGITAGLLGFTERVSARLWPLASPLPEGDGGARPGRASRALRWLVTAVAANLVGCAVALPVVAYHFEMVNPLAVVLALAAAPLIALVLALGYLKIAAGLVLPSAGVALGWPLRWAADGMTRLVEYGATWPGAVVELHSAPSLAWTVASMVVVLALLSGWLARRRVAAVAAVAVCVGWLVMGDLAGIGADLAVGRGQAPLRSADSTKRSQSPPALRLNMFAVGDGSCYLLRVMGEARGWRARLELPPPVAYTVMLDCGSQGYLNVGAATVAPALRRLGVAKLDLLLISHADLDHFGGVLDVADAVPVGKVLFPPQFLADAAARPRSATGVLLAGLAARGVAVETVSRGWEANWGEARARLLWPPADYPARPTNPASLVLQVEAGGRKVLLTGDVQDQALEQLLDEPGADYRAAVCDLAHHGAMSKPAPRWLAAIAPEVVLQSAGRERVVDDPWPGRLPEGVVRLITAELGMVEVVVGRDGRIGSAGFCGGGAAR